MSVGFIKYDYRHNLFVRYLFKKHFEDNVKKKKHHIPVENNQLIFVLKCLLSLVCDVLTFDNSKHHQTPKKAIYFLQLATSYTLHMDMFPFSQAYLDKYFFMIQFSESNSLHQNLTR